MASMSPNITVPPKIVMIEGWDGDDYLILFDEAESEQLTEGYGVRQYLPEVAVVGLLGWDDFILRDYGGQVFRIPTVPLLPKYIDEFEQIPDASKLTTRDSPARSNGIRSRSSWVAIQVRRETLSGLISRSTKNWCGGGTRNTKR